MCGRRGWEGDPSSTVDCFTMQSDEVSPHIECLSIAPPVESTIIHKAFIGRKNSALVALPGDMNTLSELFGVMCSMQTRTIERKPIILVGREYWTPIVKALKLTMLNNQRSLISKDDLNMLTITDDPEEIRTIITGGN